MPPLSNLPASNNYEGMFVNALNFPPFDFNFYQKRPPISGYDNLVSPQLKGAFHLSADRQNVATTNARISQDTLSELTIECWVKADENAPLNNGTIWYYSDNNIIFKISDPGWLVLYFNGVERSLDVSIMDGMWHHIAIVCKIGEYLEFYLDTVKTYFDNSYTVPMQGSGTFAVGNYNGGNTTFLGLIGQVRFWNKARSLQEIVYNAGRYLGPLEMNNLSLYWSDEFDVSTLTINDSSALRTAENQGVFDNPSHTPDVWNTTDYFGAIADADHLQPHPVNMSGNALITNGYYYDNLSISRDNINIEDFNAMTVEFWLKVSPVTMTLNGAVLFELRNLNNSSILITNPDSLTISFSENEATTFDTHFSLMDGNWHHLALSWESGVSVTFYVDSNPIHHVDNASAYTLPNGQTTEIYSLNLIRSGTGIYYSEVSEFRLFTSARTREEVFRDASCRIAGHVEDLLIYWPFSRSMTNDTVEDFSGNSLNGSITRGISWTNRHLFGLLANGFAAAPALSGSEDAGSPVTAWQYGQTDLTSITSGGTRVSGAIEGFPDISIDQLEQAYLNAQNHGYFDAEVFPNCYFANTTDRTEAQASIRFLDFETVCLTG
jgi:Concanavalin A-like lectin/glucanases superfamily